MAVFLNDRSASAAHSRLMLGTIILIAALALFWVAPAKAEGNCPPGYFPIGGGSAGWEGCAPMGPSNGGNSGSIDSGRSYQITSIPPRPHTRGFVAVAYHSDTGSIWASVAHKTFDAAKRRALAACNAATGGGCHIAAAVGGGAENTLSQVFVAQDGMGQFWIEHATGQDLLLTPDAAMRQCLSKSFGCDSLNGYEPGYIFLDVEPDLDQSKDYFPKGKLTWNRWAMVAQPTNATAAAHKKSWLISGSEKSEAAVNKLLDRCKAESGVPCALSAYALTGQKATDNGWIDVNGVLVHYVDSQGKNHWTSALPAPLKRKKKKSLFGGFLTRYPDPETVKERVDRFCASKCRVIATYDALTPRLQVIEDVQ